jgi:dihydroorotase
MATARRGHLEFLAQTFDLVIKGGQVIDPAQDIISEKSDVGIKDGRIAAVEKSLPESSATKVINARGLLVTPGLIDLHTHVAHLIVRLSVNPDAACLARGTTTVVDAGSTGELNFAPFRDYVINRCMTRILAMVNVESLGMVEFVDEPPNSSDQAWSVLVTSSRELNASKFVNVENTLNVIRENRRHILGVKWAHHGMRLMKLARKIARKAGVKLMIENHFMPEAMSQLDRGDIVTHLFHDNIYRHSGYRDGILEESGKRVRREFFEARKRGIILDLGHGKNSFSWSVAELAFREGIFPTTVSSDLWSGNVKGPVYDLPTVMSKCLCLGMQLEHVIASTTANAARAIGMSREIGGLTPGMRADVSIFKLRDGSFALGDSLGKSRKCRKLLMPIYVVRDGKMVAERGKLLPAPRILEASY